MAHPTKQELLTQLETYDALIDELAGLLDDETLSDREKLEEIDELLADSQDEDEDAEEDDDEDEEEVEE